MNEPRFHYIHRKGGHITIAYQIEDNKVKMGASFCSPHDQFNKKMGRRIAQNRLLGKPHIFECKGGIRDGNGNLLGENILAVIRAEIFSGLYQDSILRRYFNHHGQGEHNIPSWMYN